MLRNGEFQTARVLPQVKCACRADLNGAIYCNPVGFALMLRAVPDIILQLHHTADAKERMYRMVLIPAHAL